MYVSQQKILFGEKVKKIKPVYPFLLFPILNHAKSVGPRISSEQLYSHRIVSGRKVGSGGGRSTIDSQEWRIDLDLVTAVGLDQGELSHHHRHRHVLVAVNRRTTLAWSPGELARLTL